MGQRRNACIGCSGQGRNETSQTIRNKNCWQIIKTIIQQRIKTDHSFRYLSSKVTLYGILYRKRRDFAVFWTANFLYFLLIPLSLQCSFLWDINSITNYNVYHEHEKEFSNNATSIGSMQFDFCSMETCRWQNLDIVGRTAWS